MPQNDSRSTNSDAKVTSGPGGSTRSSPLQQFKREVSEMAYEDQVEAIRPSRPLQLKSSQGQTSKGVQQDTGAPEDGGAGPQGNKYERAAGAIADRVVQGKSAEDLIARVAGIDTVQKKDAPVQFDDPPNKDEMVKFIADKVGNPSDSSLRQAYEAGVRALATKAEAGVKELGISLSAYRNAAKSNRSGPVHLPADQDKKLVALAKELNAARLELSSSTKNLTLRPLLHFIYEKNLERYPSKYGPTYESLRAEGKTNAQCVGGACRPNPDINRFLANFRSWLGTKPEKKIKEYYADAKADRKGP